VGLLATVPLDCQGLKNDLVAVVQGVKLSFDRLQGG